MTSAAIKSDSPLHSDGEGQRGEVLARSFYERAPDVVARDLLGKVLIHRRDGERLAGRIVETEAYLGLADPASHTAVGQTAHNAVLFGEPGFADVYFIYGMYYCLNVSCLPDGTPGGVLIRAIQPREGIETMARLRGLPSDVTWKQLTGGPGRVCQALGVTRATHHGADITLESSSLQILDDGYYVERMVTTPRIGVGKAVDAMLRFVTLETIQARTVPKK